MFLYKNFFCSDLFIFGCVGLRCCEGFSLVVASGGYCLVMVQWLLLLHSTGSRGVDFSSWGSQAPGHRLSSCGTGLSCLLACETFPDQGSNWYTLQSGQIFNDWTTRKAIASF